MCGVWARASGSVWASLFLLSACAATPGASARDIADANDTGATIGAKSEADRAILRELPTLPTGSPRRVGEATIVAEAPYTAASGRSCRALHVPALASHKASDRLACSDGKTWFFVPNVFGADGSVE